MNFLGLLILLHFIRDMRVTASNPAVHYGLSNAYVFHASKSGSAAAVVALSNEYIAAADPFARRGGVKIVHRLNLTSYFYVNCSVTPAISATQLLTSAYGSSLSLLHTRLFVGAPGYEATAGDRVFIYELSALSRGGGGRQTQVLTSPLLNSSFSASIAAFDSYVAVGAPRRAGTVYVYSGPQVGSTGQYTLMQTLSNPSAYSNFGSAVAAAAGVLAVGLRGAVCIYGLSGSRRWALLQTLTPTECGSCAGSSFGLTVAMLPGMALVGDSTNTRVYFYSGSNKSASWTLQSPAVTLGGVGFGVSVALAASNSTGGIRAEALVGTQNSVAYLFKWQGGVWSYGDPVAGSSAFACPVQCAANSSRCANTVALLPGYAVCGSPVMDQVYVQTYSIALATLTPSAAPSTSRAPICPSQEPTASPSLSPSSHPVYRLPGPPSRRPSPAPISPSVAPTTSSNAPSSAPSGSTGGAAAAPFSLPAFLTLNVIIFVSVGCFVLLLAAVALRQYCVSARRGSNRKSDPTVEGVGDKEVDKAESHGLGSSIDTEPVTVAFDWLYDCAVSTSTPEYLAEPRIVSSPEIAASANRYHRRSPPPRTRQESGRDSFSNQQERDV